MKAYALLDPIVNLDDDADIAATFDAFMAGRLTPDEIRGPTP